MTSSSVKVDRILQRLHERIGDGQFYEAQQQARVVAARYVKARNFTAAADTLAGVAQSLLKAGHGGSAGDLCIMLVDVYRQAEAKPDPETRHRLLACLRLFATGEPTRKKFIGEMIAWSSKFGDCPAGDPELHHIAGNIYATERDPYEAERHLLVGTRDSATVLAKLEYKWYKESDAPHTAAQYAARAVLPSLLVGNLRAASTTYNYFAATLAADNPALGAQEVHVSTGEPLRIFPSLPLLNFLGLLLQATQRGTRDVFQQLMSRYTPMMTDVSWSEALDMIAEMYFGISKPRQTNPLLDMMGSLFGGAGFGAQAPKRTVRGAGDGGGGTGRLDSIAPEGLD